MSREIEEVVRKLPHKNSPGPDDFIDKFFQTFTKELVPIQFFSKSTKNQENTFLCFI